MDLTGWFEVFCGCGGIFSGPKLDLRVGFSDGLMFTRKDIATRYF